MKKTYETPELEVMKMECESLLCASQESIDFGTGDKGAGDALSNEMNDFDVWGN